MELKLIWFFVCLGTGRDHCTDLQSKVSPYAVPNGTSIMQGRKIPLLELMKYDFNKKEVLLKTQSLTFHLNTPQNTLSDNGDNGDLHNMWPRKRRVMKGQQMLQQLK